MIHGRINHSSLSLSRCAVLCHPSPMKRLLTLTLFVVVSMMAVVVVKAHGGSCRGGRCPDVIPVVQPIFNTPPGPIIITGPNVPITISAIINQNTLEISPVTVTQSVTTLAPQSTTLSATISLILVKNTAEQVLATSIIASGLALALLPILLVLS